MADYLTTSGINSLISSYIQSETQNKVVPLQNKASKYSGLSTGYSTLLSKIESFRGKLQTLKATGNSSAFLTKKGTSSNTKFLTATATTSASIGAYSLRINQLAKSDLLISEERNSNDASSISAPGTYKFVVKSGDGEGGQLVSNVTVTLSDSDFTNGVISNLKLSQKISKAVQDDKAVISSNSVNGSTTSSGSFKVNVNGTETTINYSQGTYEEVIDNIISQINAISGLTATKIVDGNNISFSVTGSTASKYIALTGDTGSLLNELGISSQKEIAASGLINVSVISPTPGSTQISISAKKTGSSYALQEVSDLDGSNLLDSFALNVGTSRPAFQQNLNGTDTAGFVHQLTDLRAKILFNGLTIERDSNAVSDLINGVTFNLLATMSDTDEDVTINVDNDTTAVKTKIEEFISAFNDLYSYLKNNNTVNDGNRGLFVGDSSASSLLNILSSTSYTSIPGITIGEIQNLSQIGITFNINSGLSISDSAQLTDALTTKADQIENLFTSSSGIAVKLYDRLTPYVGAAGYLTSSKTRLESNIKYINDSITSAQNSINKSAESLRKTYQQLQLQLASLYNMSNLFSGG